LLKKKINHVDYFWLRLDRPENRMNITGIMIFSEPFSYDRLVSILSSGLKPFRRFYQKVVFPNRLFTRPYWEDDPDFSIERHIQTVDLPPGAGKAELEALASQILCSDLDWDRPLWKVTLIEKYGGGSAIIAQMHHSITDGISLVQVILSMTEPVNGDPLQVQPALAVSPVGQEGNRNPLNRRKSEETRLTLKQAIARVFEIIHLLFLPPDPKTIFKKPLGIEKRTIWTDRFELSLLREIVRKEKVSLNDVMMSITTGGLQRYLVNHGQSSKISHLRGFILFNLRPRQLDEELGNKFGITFLELPVRETDPKERLKKVKKNMDEIKSSAQAGATYWVQAILGATPAWLERLTSRLLDAKGTVVMTNVPASRVQLAMGGVPIEMLMAWVPQSGRVGIGVSFVTYNRKVVTGINVDAGIIPDPRELEEYMYQEYLCLLDKCQD
jgi:WS/DGAT/MGAT family acyltransferase